MSRRPNTTQRSWSDYEGDNPKKKWVGRSSQGEARFYSDSNKFGPGSTWKPASREDEIPEGYEKDPVTNMLRRVPLEDRFAKSQREWDLKQEKQKGKSRVKKALNDMRGNQPVGTEYDENLFVS
jgi:hypothetical protein